VENQPDGQYVASVRDQYVVTQNGRVDMTPGGNPLYVRLSPDGTKFAGQGHMDGHAWQYMNGAWGIADPLAFGVSPCFYKTDNSLIVSHGKGVGSQGYRYQDYVTGQIFTGDQTYASAAMQLWEYTCRGDVCCGQGGTGLQCLFLTTKKRVILEPGDNRFVRFNAKGDLFAISSAKLPENKSVMFWITRAELEALPAYVTPPSPVKSSPTPEIEEPEIQEGDDNNVSQVKPVQAGKPKNGPSAVHAGKSKNGPSAVHAGKSKNGPSSVQAGKSKNGPTSVKAGKSKNGPSAVHAGKSKNGPSAVHAGKPKNGPSAVHAGKSKNGPSAVHAGKSKNGPTSVKAGKSKNGPSAVHAGKPKNRPSDDRFPPV
jgi:hypothetical protein